MTIDINDAYPITLLALCIWREARGEVYATKQAVACSIRNRVQRPGWWGHSWIGCILMPHQYSSFNRNDPNASKFPEANEPAWQDSFDIATKVYQGTMGDNSAGATSYFDASLDDDPPKWTTDGSNTHTVDLGRLRFYKLTV